MAISQWSFPREFPTTRWSMVAMAGHGDSDGVRRAALEALLRGYLPALRSHLRSRHHLRHDVAEDLLQGFVTDQVVHRNLVAKAQRGRGRFRAFLVTALDNYVVSHRRRQQAAKRAPEQGLSLNELAHEPAHAQTPQHAFDLAFARSVLANTLARMEAECRDKGQEQRWAIFTARVVAPALGQAQAPAYEELVERLGFASPLEASNVLVSAKRMFERLFRQVVAEYTADEDVEAEIAAIRAVLGDDGAR